MTLLSIMWIGLPRLFHLPESMSPRRGWNVYRAENEIVTAGQARWAALRMALEPRRYPVAQLDGFARCITAADVVLTRFESKAADLSVSGTARSAKDAYTFFNAVSKDGPLGVYAWSMLQPTIAADGSATFEIKGKMR